MIQNLSSTFTIRSDFLIFFQVKEYDYYGSYENKSHDDYLYRDLLDAEYTFDFPPHHDTVSCEWIMTYSNIIYVNPVKYTELSHIPVLKSWKLS